MALSQGERRELTEIVALTATLQERLTHCDRRLVETIEIHRQTSQSINENCKKYELALADLAKDVQLKEWQGELKEASTDRTRFLRTFWPPVVAVFLSVLLAPLGVKLWNYVGLLLGP